MDFPDLLSRRADLDGDRTALVDVPTERELTYADLDRRASRAARVLRDHWDVGPGDRIASLAHNRTDLFELLFACAKLGAVLVPLNWRLAVPELEYIVADADPVGLVTDDAFVDAAAQLRERVPGLRSMAYGTDALDTEDAYEDLLADTDPAALVHSPRAEDALWYLLYTSGTTGRPKGVIQTFGMALVNHLNIGLAAQLTSADTFLSVLPQFHTAGINLYTLPMLVVGGTTLVTRTFDPAETLRLLQERATVFFGVPTIYQLLADHPDFAGTDLSRIRSWACGGAPMPVPLLERLGERDIGVRQGMGMTETGPTVFLLDEQHAISHAGSVGRPQPFVEVRVVDREGNNLPDGEAGELLIRGPGVTPGYWRKPDVTAEAFEDDGWLHSGDVARRDQDGYWYIVDRWKDMYISGGENVYPAEVEQVLYRLPGVDEAAVVGVADERWGEVGRAYVVVRPDAELDAEAVRHHCREQLAAYKVPAEVAFVDELPRNATGKILKHELRARASA